MSQSSSAGASEKIANRSQSDRPAWLNLFTASALALFVELVLIRWIPSVVHVMGFFANVVLIASFLGLGAGMMTKRSESGERAAIRLAVLVGCLAIYRMLDPAVGLGANTSYGFNEVVFTSAVRIPLPITLVGVFSLVAWALIPFGSIIAELFDDHERIPAYTINITGSLVGVLAFTGVSAMGLPSVAWFGVVLALLAVLAPSRTVVLSALVVVSASAAVFWVDSNRLESSVLWSPYNQLRVRPLADSVDDGFAIDVNNQFLLTGLNLAPGSEDSPDVSPEYAP